VVDSTSDVSDFGVASRSAICPGPTAK
jgi:hypothetical protein